MLYAIAISKMFVDRAMVPFFSVTLFIGLAFGTTIVYKDNELADFENNWQPFIYQIYTVIRKIWIKLIRGCFLIYSFIAIHRRDVH